MLADKDRTTMCLMTGEHAFLLPLNLSRGSTEVILLLLALGGPIANRLSAILL